jgi:hypothetical protein
MEERKKITRNKAVKNEAQKRRDTDLVIFLAEQEDIRDERGEFEWNGIIFKTLVEIRPADNELPEDVWDTYIIIDGHFYLSGSFTDPDEASKHVSSIRMRLEKIAKSYIASYLNQRKMEL